MSNNMFKKVGAIMLAAVTGIMTFACGAQGNASASDKYGSVNTFRSTEVDMTKAEKEYKSMLENPETVPVNFVYNDKYYSGFSPKYFKKKSETEKAVDGGVQTTTVFSFRGELEVTLVSAVYPEYSAYDYTVYFENNTNKNSGVIRKLNAADIAFDCEGARLKGIYGDYDYMYAPYDFDLKEKPVNFTSTRGRACHTYFPYFNLEAEGNGSILALGWGGTWQADFAYDKAGKKAHYIGTGTVGLETYLKPGEKIRTPLVALVRYYDADEDAAMNMWRKWYIDCNMPYETAEKTNKVPPQEFMLFGMDTGRAPLFASVSETHETWKNSFDAFYDKLGTIDYQWVDAGWYTAPSGNTIDDWWGDVGTWTLDRNKWPGESFNERVAYGEERGVKMMMWFEPERITHVDDMVKNCGYKRTWVLSDVGRNNHYINNIGIDECREWTRDRILNTMGTYGISLYREDFNIDPAVFWSVGDGYQGDSRKGITENLYMQGHYKMWDEIIEWGAQNGKCTYIDSCASGGGRNDLESMRRAVPLLRSDADGAGIATRLAFDTTFTKWIPYNGAYSKEGTYDADPGVTDTYTLRASMMPSVWYISQFYHNNDGLPWDEIKAYREERKTYEKFFFSDYYVLTPYRGVSDNSQWTAFMYFDNESDSGVISAFRPTGCTIASETIKIKGVNPDGYYRLRDTDGKQSVDRIKGSELADGLTLTAKHDRTAMIIYIEPTE